MFDILKVLIISSLLFIHIDSTCIVTKYNSNERHACVFPFTFTDNEEKETHIACTNRLDPDGRYWCSTKVCVHN